MTSPTRKQTNKDISFALRQLLLKGNAGTHEDICRLLQQQGFSVNQPKVSRLLHKIGAVKVVNPQGENSYRLPHEHGLIHELSGPSAKLAAKQWVIDIVSNTVLIVIHTTPGAASLVAREIDAHHLHFGILGSIAGDDTVFIAPKNIQHIPSIIEHIKTMLEL